MKKVLVKGAVFLSVLFAPMQVNAKGIAKVEFYGDNDITVGETFTVRMGVSDIRNTYDGVVSFGGNLLFDENTLEYVSSKGVVMPYVFQINESANYIIAGLDFTLNNGIRNDLIVYEFTFKAKEAGNTTITFDNAKLTDSQDYIDTIVLDKTIVVENKTEEATKKSVTEEIANEEKVVAENVVEKEQDKKQATAIKEDSDSAENAADAITEIVEKEEKIEAEQPEKTIVNKIAEMLEKIFSDFIKMFK